MNQNEMICVNEKKNILWICGIAWRKEDGTYFPEATYPGIVSGSAFQQAIIEGLEEQDYRVRILSDCDMSSGCRLEWSHNGKSRDIRVAGNGNKYLRIPKKIKELLHEIKHGNVLDGIDYVFAYEMHIPYLVCLHQIKRVNPQMKTILICPDLSIHMDLDAARKPIKTFLKKIENIVAKILLKEVDGYILFTEQMQEYFRAYKKPHAVVEGVYCDKYALDAAIKKPFIMHAGSLHHNTGIEELIEAFEQISDPETQLWFFGSGVMDEYIQRKALNNSRIKHMGFVDPQKLFEYEKQALLLVNVRNPNAAYTKYSFPSKTFEYMASGTPFLSTDLPGIPNEYKRHLLLIDNNSVDEIRKGLEHALSFTAQERNDFGEKARSFVLNKKNKYIQSGKIAVYLKKLDTE